MSAPTDPPAGLRLAHTTDYAFVDALVGFREDAPPRVGDLIEPEDLETLDGQPFESAQAEVIAVDLAAETVTLRDTATGRTCQAGLDQWLYVVESPVIQGVFEAALRRPDPDGVAWADGAVPPALIERLRRSFRALLEHQPVDHHPGSEGRVRDLVHPSLYPYIEGLSVLNPPVERPAPTPYDRFGRPYESSRYQWLPTPFAIDPAGQARALGPINNLAPALHAEVVPDLEALLSLALPLFESVLGYIDHCQLWHPGQEAYPHEAELPQPTDRSARPAPPTPLRDRTLLIIPKIVEYRLQAGDRHEGVWHVEGMSHEHIVATCVYVLDRDPALAGGTLRFKRPYTVEEAGHLFWSVDQARPAPVDDVVAEGAVPVGSLDTPEGRLLVFPNSHTHKLSPLTVAEGSPEAVRRIIVFWLVDPQVQIPSTREATPLQGVITWPEALAARLDLMEERRHHKQSHNLRVVSLCEH